MSATKMSRVTQIETRSIDYVPGTERSGKLIDQSTIWFSGSSHILSLATGAIGLGLGLNLGWTLIALAIGNVIGTIPCSAHATQGPHLGLPQMVQSRPQFGRFGALFIWLLAIIIYWGYVVLGGDLLGQTGHQLGWGSVPVWTVICGVIAIALAIYGYHWLHIIQRWIAATIVIGFVIYIVGIIVIDLPTSTPSLSLTSSFMLGPFLAVISTAAGYQLTWAFFMSDYSRYMPYNTNRVKIIGYTSLGLYLGIMSFEIVGAIGAALLPGKSVTAALVITGNYIFPGFGGIFLFVGALGLLGLTAMCIYGGSLTIITAMDSFWPVRPTRWIRTITILLVGITGTWVAIVIPEGFLNTDFYMILAICAYLIGPWTAINLVDFFLIRKGDYSISEIFRKDGLYGYWNKRGILTYFVTFLIMLPFMDLSFYIGPFARMTGIDLTFFIGIPSAAIIYWLMCKSMNIDYERSVIKDSDKDIEKYAKPVE